MRLRKSFGKRIRITKTGKAMRRPMGIDHFRSKKTGKARRNTRKAVKLIYPI